MNVTIYNNLKAILLILLLHMDNKWNLDLQNELRRRQIISQNTSKNIKAFFRRYANQLHILFRTKFLRIVLEL